VTESPLLLVTDLLAYPCDVCKACKALAPLRFAPCNLTRCPRELTTVRDVVELREITGRRKS
jgi:hypothetical protein